MLTVVHIITGLNDGGAEATLYRFCVSDVKYRHIVISLLDEGKYGSVLRAAGVDVYSMRFGGGVFGIVSSFFKLVRIIRKIKPDVVQTWMYHANLIGGVASLMAGGFKVYWGIHHSELTKESTKKRTLLVSKISAVFSRFLPRRVICCAHSSVVVHESYGYDSSKMVVIPNGYDLSKFKPFAGCSEKIRREFGISSTSFVIGAVGRWHPYKDYNTLLSSLSIFADKKIEYSVLLVGHDLSEENQMLVSRLKELNLESNVILTGPRPDIPSVMNALDVHLLTSVTEAFPNVLCEAMACGVPCISTDVGDAGQILGNTGILCSVKDAECIADAIYDFWYEWKSDEAGWHARQDSAREWIENNYALKKMVDSYHSCWES